MALDSEPDHEQSQSDCTDQGPAAQEQQNGFRGIDELPSLLEEPAADGADVSGDEDAKPLEETGFESAEREQSESCSADDDNHCIRRLSLLDKSASDEGSGPCLGSLSSPESSYIKPIARAIPVLRNGLPSASGTYGGTGRSRKAEFKGFQAEENESACCECEGGGELVCCDTCIRAFHLLCLPQQYRPLEYHDSSIAGRWSCPVCLYFRVHDDLEKRRGVLLSLRHPLPVPSPDCDPRTKRLKSGRRMIPGNDAAEPTSGEDDEDFSSPNIEASQRRIKRFNHQDLYRESHHHYLFEDIKKQRAAVLNTGDSHGGLNNTTDVPTCRTTRRSAAAAAAADKKSDSGASSTTSSGAAIARMNVGPMFQIPNFPVSFLELQSLGRSYDEVEDNRHSRAIAETRVVYSVTDWKDKAKRLGTTTPFDSADTSPRDIIEEVLEEESVDPLVRELEDEVREEERRLEREELQREREDFVDTEEKLVQFCHTLSSRWPAYCHWPYSTEYAYKILQHAGFNAKAALSCVEDPSFDFQTVCDPPLRPYFNKWRPKDKRSLFPSTPFPPPQHLRASYGSVGTRTRLQKER